MTIYSLDVFLSLFGTSSVVPSQGTMMNDSSKIFSDSNQMSVVAFSYESLPRSRIHGLFFFFFFSWSPDTFWGRTIWRCSLWEAPCSFASLVAQTVKNLPAMWETWVQSLDWENPLEKEIGTHSSILAWRIPWTEEPGKLQSMEFQRVGHNCMTNTSHLWL